MAKPSLTNIILFYNKTIGRKELFYKKCNIWLISLDLFLKKAKKTIQKSKKKCYTMIIYDRRIKTDEANKIIFINVFNTVFFFC